MNVIVTGGLGDLARPMLNGLLQNGHRVVAFDLEHGAQTTGDVEVVIGDVRDREALSKAADGCDCMLHLAAVSGESEAKELMDVNVMGTFNALSVSQELSLKRFVMTSSAPVHIQLKDGRELAFPLVTGGGGDHAYDLTKTLQEVMARDYSNHGLQSVCLRIGHVVDGRHGVDLEGTPLSELEYCRGGWVDMQDVANGLVAAISVTLHEDFTILHLVSSRSSRSKYRVEETTRVLNIELLYDFAEYDQGI